MTSSNWSDRSLRRGLTLVEVVTGIALLTSLLALILASFRGHSLQVRGAKDRMQAIVAAEELLDTWFAGAGIPPVGQQAPLSQHPGWLWRLVPGQPLDNPSLSGAIAVRLEIFTRENFQERILTTVELMDFAKGAPRP